jgi:redox-sensing transcriptional repressor
MQYYRFLSELTASKAIRTVTSAQIAEALEIDPTQVRKDFGAVGILGISRVGYDIGTVCRAISLALGFDRRYEAVLIGTGHLGCALLTYSGFARYGLYVVMAFDNDKSRIGSAVAGCAVQPMQSMNAFITSRKIRLAVLAPPIMASRRLADRLASTGVKAIWNFTPAHLANPPHGVLVRNERHFSIGLSEIAYYLKQQSMPDERLSHNAANSGSATKAKRPSSRPSSAGSPETDGDRRVILRPGGCMRNGSGRV